MRESWWKGMITGAAGGLVAWWAMDRFYKLARASSTGHAVLPFYAGAGLGAAYGGIVLRQHPAAIARLPLGAALYMAKPEREQPRNLAMRLASKGLKKAVTKAVLE